MVRSLQVPPLTSVKVVCRASTSRIDTVEELVGCIDAFVGIASHWTVPLVCAEDAPNALRWLPRAAAQEPQYLDPIVKRKRFADALQHAVRRGDLSVAKWLVEVYLPNGRIRQAVGTAAAYGQLEILQWLRKCHDSRVVWGHKELALAARSGHVATVKWLIERSGSFLAEDRTALLQSAMEHGNVDMIELLCSVQEKDLDRNGLVNADRRFSCLDSSSAHKCMASAVGSGHHAFAEWLYVRIGARSVEMSAIADAARNGQLDMIKWALANLSLEGDERYPSAMDSAATWGHLNVVKYLHENWSRQCSTDAMNYAAYGGHFEVVRWLHEHRREGCTTLAMDLAALAGHIEIVKWLHDHRSEGCTPRAMDAAAANGHLELVQWLHENRTEGCTTGAMDGAAASNHLELLQWLHENRSEGCTTRAMDQAAANGHLTVVQWLHDHRSEGCTTRAIDEAASNGHLAVVEWLYKHQSQACTSRSMIGAASNGHLAVVKWLHWKGVQVSADDAVRNAAQFGHLNVVRWLLTNLAFKGESEALKHAIFGGHFDVVVALCEDGRSGCSVECFRAAIQRDQPEILQLLVRRFGRQTSGVMAFIHDRVDPHSRANAYIRDCLVELSTAELTAA